LGKRIRVGGTADLAGYSLNLREGRLTPAVRARCGFGMRDNGRCSQPTSCRNKSFSR